MRVFILDIFLRIAIFYSQLIWFLLQDLYLMAKWLKLKEAADYLKMGRSTLYKFVGEGTIPAHKIGREWRFDAEELDKWMKSGRKTSSKASEI